jgi:hypothetical protein
MLEEDADATNDETGEPEATPRPVQRFSKSTPGVMLAAGMLGLREAMFGPQDDEPAIVEDWAGGEPHNDPYVLRLDPEHPEDSIVMIRPWLKKSSETTD